MMENAGAIAVRRLVEKLGNVESKNILIFVGLGNNGGDGLVMARHLAGYGAKVTVMLLLSLNASPAFPYFQFSVFFNYLIYIARNNSYCS